MLDQVVGASGRGDRARGSAAEYWSGLLTTPGHPLATQLPDEPLVDWYERGLLGELDGARVLDVGCGGARNTRWFAEHGATVDGVDLAAELLDQLRPSMPDAVTLTTLDVLRDPLPDRAYDVVYDSGCFHHIAPHRRITYLERILPLVRAGGRFGIVTFAAERMETPSDLDVVSNGDTYGGMTFSLDDLRTIFGALTPLDLRPVRADREHTFAADFLNAGLFTTP
ncbi:class I SAM-dependent methyltransferase [Kribbella sp. HUAS MG21]|uniref:Class I SAM-dependent methyltransferase n=1 Tax=Kribbella sp. HUAS MG21 TaxID=3160966 RepID=A0AAU7TPZ4_9ACTN